MNVNLNVSVKGRFKIEAFRQDEAGNEVPGSRRVAADWFDNLITNVGLDTLASKNGTNTGLFNILVDSCVVGSGSTAPAFTNTALVSQIAATTTQQADTGTLDQLVTAPFYYYRRRTYRFGTGVAAGNLAEVGMKIGAVLWSRALIVDGGGNPITLTVLADEALDVTYEYRIYPPTADVPWSADISGVTYSGNIRAANVTSGAGEGSWRHGLNSLIGTSGAAMAGVFAVRPGCASFSTQTLGAITAQPAGTATTLVSTVSASAYTAGNFYRDHTLTSPLNSGNSAGGIGSIRIDTYLGNFQISFSPILPKNNTKIMTLNVRVSWGRYP